VALVMEKQLVKAFASVFVLPLEFELWK